MFKKNIKRVWLLSIAFFAVFSAIALADDDRDERWDREDKYESKYEDDDNKYERNERSERSEKYEDDDNKYERNERSERSEIFEKDREKKTEKRKLDSKKRLIEEIKLLEGLNTESINNEIFDVTGLDNMENEVTENVMTGIVAELKKTPKIKNVKKIERKKQGDKTIFSVEVSEKGSLFGFIDMDFDKEIIFSEDGQDVEYNEPWYWFLIF